MIQYYWVTGHSSLFRFIMYFAISALSANPVLYIPCWTQSFLYIELVCRTTAAQHFFFLISQTDIRYSASVSLNIHLSTRKFLNSCILLWFELQGLDTLTPPKITSSSKSSVSCTFEKCFYTFSHPPVPISSLCNTTGVIHWCGWVPLVPETLYRDLCNNILYSNIPSSKYE